MSTPKLNSNFLNKAVQLLQYARSKVVHTINQVMVYTYYEIGRMIIEEEQQGKERAQYGKGLLNELSKTLTVEFGKGFSIRNIEQMRKFYLVYSKTQTVSADSDSLISEIASRVSNLSKTQTPLAESDSGKQQKTSTYFELSWSHYLKLMRIDNENERKFYEIEAGKNNWSVRELDRQYDAALYTRLTLSRDKKGIQKLSEKGLVLENPKDAIKDPYILEFIGLPEKPSYSESDLEQGIIDKLEHFLLELGTGFTFVARQKRISFDDKHFRIDLVFYNRILKCFILIDLKIGELKHQDIGQMQMYVNYYDRQIKLEEENKTIGLILCQNKSEAVVQYTLPENNEQIFASKYKTILPSKEDLKLLIKEPE
ncbi:MAG: PDDEXK nuclease domain-containing protein [Lutibacter sp.]|nr:PDDEXK nuclease domain-containing protein [Lutibacter sp.]